MPRMSLPSQYQSFDFTWRAARSTKLTTLMCSFRAIRQEGFLDDSLADQPTQKIGELVGTVANLNTYIASDKERI